MTVTWRHTIGARLAAITFTMLLLALGLTAASVWMLSASIGGAHWIDAASTTRSSVMQMVLLAEQLPENTGADRDRLRLRLIRNESEMQRRLTMLRNGSDDEDVPAPSDDSMRTRLAHLETRWDSQLAPIFDVITAPDATNAALDSQIVLLRQRAGAFNEQLDELIAEYADTLEAEQHRFGYLHVGFALLTLLFFLFVSLAGHRWLYMRMRSLVATADAIADGDLSHPVPHDGRDEVAVVGRSIERMTANLRSSLDEVATNAARLRAVLDAIPDALMTIDTRGTVLSVNRAACRIFGYSPDEILGQNVRMLMPSPYHEEHDEYLASYLRTGEKHVLDRERELVGKRKNGEVFPLSLWVSELRHGDERMFIGVIRDITVIKKRDKQRAQILETVTRVSQRVAAASAQIVAAVTQQASSAQEQATAVSETVTTVHEVTGTANQSAERARTVADSARRSEELGRAGQAAVQRSIEVMEAARTHVESTAERILDLAEQARAIGTITATVNEIAERTNLLALNAGIEASRAGEHGRGFAVVAAEVKALAERAKDATAQVRTILLDIQKATHSAVLATEDGTRRVNEAMHNVTDAGQTIEDLARLLIKAVDIASQIAASAGQQAAGLDQVDEAMQQVRSATQQTLGATRELESAARDLNGHAEELTALLSLDEPDAPTTPATSERGRA